MGLYFQSEDDLKFKKLVVATNPAQRVPLTLAKSGSFRLRPHPVGRKSHDS